MKDKFGETICGDCGVTEGAYHHPGCDMERCPFCTHQLISCNCIYELLNIYDDSKYTEETNFLPPKVYYNGPTKEQIEKFDALLSKKGRIPFIHFPLLCAKCGEHYPDFFFLTNEEWEYYIPPDQRKEIICRPCYETIVKMIDKLKGKFADKQGRSPRTTTGLLLCKGKNQSH